MDIKLRYKEGHALAISDDGRSRFIKLILKDEVLEVLEKVNPARLENVNKNQEILLKNKMATESSFAYSKLPVERTVELSMELLSTKTSLGISIKGGTDFNLPILISKIIPGERADKTNQLFVGDAILELNGKSFLSYTHKAAVNALQSAGSNVSLRVRHLPHAATVLLNEGIFKKKLSIVAETQEPKVNKTSVPVENNLPSLNNNSSNQTSNHLPNKCDFGESTENICKLPTDEYSYLTDKYTNKKFSKDNSSWIVGLRISLQYAYLSVFEYNRVAQQEKYDSFIIKTVDGHSTGIISFKDSNIFHYWKEAIKFNINALLINAIKKINQSICTNDQIHYMGWLFCLGHSKAVDLYSCKRYYESEYTNVRFIEHDTKLPAISIDNSQYKTRKQRSLETSPSNKWCYMFGNSSQKPAVDLSQKSQLTNHSQANLSELSPSSLLHTQIFQRTKYSKIEKPLFLVLRGIHLYLFIKPPQSLGDWFSPFLKVVISRTMINQRKTETPGQISNSCSNEDALSSRQAISDSNTSHLNSIDRDIFPTQFILQVEETQFDCIVDCPSDLLELEIVWVKVNYHTVCHIKVDTFRCSYQNLDCILCLDFDYGIKLINATDGIKIWHFKFHQLRASSDDGDNRLRLIFSDTINNETRIIDQILHCHNLPTLLISIQSFLTAKLGQVDPHYFDR